MTSRRFGNCDYGEATQLTVAHLTRRPRRLNSTVLQSSIFLRAMTWGRLPVQQNAAHISYLSGDSTTTNASNVVACTPDVDAVAVRRFAQFDMK
jgi:hypothetical protein